MIDKGAVSAFLTWLKRSLVLALALSAFLFASCLTAFFAASSGDAVLGSALKYVIPAYKLPEDKSERQILEGINQRRVTVQILSEKS